MLRVKDVYIMILMYCHGQRELRSATFPGIAKAMAEQWGKDDGTFKDS